MFLYVRIPFPGGWVLIVTKSGEAAAKDGEPVENVRFDPAVAELRSVVERSFAWLKQFRILKNFALMANVDRCRKSVLLAAALVNWLIDTKNIEQI